MLFTKKQYLTGGSPGQLAWKKFRKNALAFGAFVFILATVGIAILGYLIAPDHTPLANAQNLVISNQKPGFRADILKIPSAEKNVSRNLFHRMLFGEKRAYDELAYSGYFFRSDSIFLQEYSGDKTDSREYGFPLIRLLPVTVSAYRFYPVSGRVSIIGLNGNTVKTSIGSLREQVKSENLTSRKYILGTDRFGRDVLSQLLIGTRVSLSVGFISVLISLVLGILLGALAGFHGGWIDQVISWFINVIWAIPTLLLVIAVTFALGKGFWQVFIAIGLTMWVEVARVVRGQFISLREKEYVEATRALGYGNARIIFRHILPNALSPVIVISAANFASAILLEAGLSFLGIGVQPPMPSWGAMIRENYGYIVLDYAYLAVLPGCAIMIMVLAFMLVGNGLRDALDVRTTG